ncbi:MAG: DegQ family serine endoprotease [Nitrincola lacisaponensis]|uniref:Probable periplasmic serine endoprotease DegP-like n=1 Tax=Nitrincola lacisaponensis TaxID=267850 RepID=A0A063Y342_9GAMM|nr:DegQ family serine endoprotease [Nitrincola lacisaponensis]KDE39565.1 HtrA protease/chaperone protein [Nitrincola lacisaponensis]
MKKVHLSLGGLLLLLLVSVQTWAQQLPDFKTLVRETSPAVVNISTVQKAPDEASDPFGQFRGPGGEELPDIFRHFFRGFPEISPSPRRGNPAPRSLGSGFILSEDGYILTNHHVIRDADQVIVRLSDRRELEAEVIGSDPRSDVALLKVDAQGLPTVKTGRSADVEVGEWVLAIGSPFGFDHSVTAGIVSATERSLANDTYVPFIQTDVAINPGNSGGPLFNLDGEVIGINSQIYTRSGGFMGLSFAIPIDVAMEVADQLRDTGSVTRGWLGVVIQEVSRDLAESFGLDKPAGALVVNVMSDSPAQAAGLREGDVIVRFNGNDITLSSDLPHQVGRIRPGEKADVEVIRDGRLQTLTATIGLLPDEDQLARRSRGEPDADPADTSLGLVVTPLTQEQRSRWNLSSGVLVTQVNEGPGARAGLVNGDVITMLNGERIETVDQFHQVVQALPEDRAVPMRIVRRGSAMFIPLRLNP